MKAIPCTIEVCSTAAETYWYITVSAEAVPEAALMFGALHLGRIDKILFRDGKQQFTVRANSAALGEHAVSIDKTWLDALWCQFTDTHLNGWTDTAHLDQDFCDVSITVAILPPKE